MRSDRGGFVANREKNLEPAFLFFCFFAMM